MIVAVKDKSTGATLVTGRRYPLAGGGWCEFLRARVPGFWSAKSGAFCRYSGGGRVRASYGWIWGHFDPFGSTVWVDLPPLNYRLMGRVGMANGLARTK